MLVKRAIAYSYLEFIVGKVIYAEDNIYRLMLYKNKSTSWFSFNPVLYEFGNGISTNESDVWSKRIHSDWNAANDILRSWIIKGTQTHFDKKLLAVMDHSFNPDLKNKIKMCFLNPEIIPYRFLTKINPRQTPEVYKKEFIEELLN